MNNNNRPGQNRPPRRPAQQSGFPQGGSPEQSVNDRAYGRGQMRPDAQRNAGRPRMSREEYESRRREYLRRKAEAEAKRKRARFILVAAAVALVLLIVVIIAVACSGSKTDKPAQTEPTTEVRTEAVAEPVTDPPEPEGLMKYAAVTDKTRTLTTEVDSEYAILIDVASNTVLATKGGDKKIYPASMTKVLTLIVAYENCKDLDDTFEMTNEIVGTLYQENATVAGFLPGEQCRIRDLMYGLILPSGADAAWALALYTAGSVEGFADMMNAKVSELGLKNSHFMNPTGLHDKDQYSTCHDIAKILEYAAQDEFLRKVLSTYEYTTAKSAQNPDGITLYSTMQQRLVGDEAPGMYILGGKTGYTTEAHNCLASYAVRYDKAKDSIDEIYTRKPEYIFVTASGGGIWIPIFDAINTYATIVDPNALETRFTGK